jgi:hypothetical protein
MRFKPGQQVVCIKKNEWVTSPGIAPKFNEVCTFERYSNTGDGFLVFKEYKQKASTGGRNAYNFIWFEPLVSDEVLEAALTEAFT